MRVTGSEIVSFARKMEHAVRFSIFHFPSSNGAVPFPRPRYRPVFRMLTRANRVMGAPWLTEFDCVGCPLPSLNAPPSA